MTKTVLEGERKAGIVAFINNADAGDYLSAPAPRPARRSCFDYRADYRYYTARCHHFDTLSSVSKQTTPSLKRRLF
jgi:hypothetical protein